MYALKRPFDDYTQPRIRLEGKAVLELLATPSERLVFLRSAAHDIENAQNPLPWRARRVTTWLDASRRSLHHLQALDALPAEMIVHPRIVVSRTGEAMLRRAKSATFATGC